MLVAVPSRKQMTPLMYAARKGCPHVVSLLVAHGSHINAQDENGYSVSGLLMYIFQLII